MIEIKVKLARTNSAIYATGEHVDCFIEFIHKVFDSNANKKEQVENLAWASAQLHCYRTTNCNFNKALDLADLIGRTTLDAVTQAPGDIILATKPKILFCDLQLKPGEKKTYFFSDNIPRDGPPTYRGHDIKYFYKITIATQRVRAKVQTLTVPLRVLPIPIIARPEDLPCTEETNEELTPTNPFLEKREVSELEISWHYVKNITARRSPKFFRISNKHGFVARFCLFKSCYKLGEDIVGSLDFRDCQVRCVQFSVKLQSQEILLVDNFNQQNKNGEGSDTSSVRSLDLASIASGSAADNLHKSTTAGNVKAKNSEEPSGKIATYSTNHQVCYSMLQTHIVVPVPLHITPSFTSDVVDVRWRLHFEFVTSTMMDFGKPNPEEGELKAPLQIPVETMAWDLPITLYTANPLQMPQCNQPFTLLIK